MIKVGTDFSGIGAPEMALKYLGIEYESIFSCEIDKYARESYIQFHNTNIMYEDITKRNHKEVEQLDLYVAGFPCQSFSTAGKRKGFDEARGTLFFNVAEFIQINQPKVFILENVKGLLSHDSGKTFQTIIDILSNGGGTINSQISFDMFDDGLGYHIYYKVLNTKDFGIPQNRERIFIVGFKDFREFSFPKPIELKLRLGDMLQDNPKFAISGKYQPYPRNYKELGLERIERFEKRDDNLSNCLLANEMSYIEVENKYYLSDKGIENLNKNQEFNKFNPLNTESELVACITARCNKVSNDNNFIKVDDIKLKQIGNIANKNSWDNPQCGRIYDVNGLSPCLNTMQGGGKEPKTLIKNKIRRLTPLECWRLQGFRDEDFFSVKDVSDSQLYKQAGNSITVNVLMELFKKIYEHNN
jgi:DNA (cytosine-5)-methyltransferase 1